MMTQEKYMDVIALHRQGWTNKQIAAALNRHPTMISKWIEAGGPPIRREFSGESVIHGHWKNELLEANSDLLATSILWIVTHTVGPRLGHRNPHPKPPASGAD